MFNNIDMWLPVFGLFFANLAIIVPLFVWNRSESRSDIRHILAVMESIQKEMKDFHGRLCAIEEKNKGR